MIGAKIKIREIQGWGGLGNDSAFVFCPDLSNDLKMGDR